MKDFADGQYILILENKNPTNLSKNNNEFLYNKNISKIRDVFYFL